jgi:hypothetical protein
MGEMFGGGAKETAEKQQRMAIAQAARQSADADRALAAARGGASGKGQRLLRFLDPTNQQKTLG